MKRYAVIVSAAAEQDLADIHAAIAQHSLLNAARFLERLEHAILGLADIGDALTLVPESRSLRKRLHHLIVRPYRIIYRVEGDEVIVAHVRHATRRRLRNKDVD